jgi:CRP-like cAMP-binding protein
MFIQEAELFERIPSHIIDEIAEFAIEESYPADHVLFSEGDLADDLYILEDGQVHLALRGEDLIVFPVTQEGSVFGWSAIVEPQRYTTTAKFAKDSKVIKIHGERMLVLLEKHPHEGLIIMRRLAGVIATRLVQSYHKLRIAGPRPEAHS